MSTINDWLRPGTWALIDGAEYECCARFDFDRRGGGMVLLRPSGACTERLLAQAVSAALEDLADLEAEGLVSPAQGRTKAHEGRRRAKPHGISGLADPDELLPA